MMFIPGSKEDNQMMKVVSKGGLTYRFVITYYDLKLKQREIYLNNTTWNIREEYKVDSEVELLKVVYMGPNAEKPGERNSIRKEKLYFKPEQLNGTEHE